MENIVLYIIIFVKIPEFNSKFIFFLFFFFVVLSLLKSYNNGFVLLPWRKHF